MPVLGTSLEATTFNISWNLAVTATDKWRRVRPIFEGVVKVVWPRETTG